jgi:hypothetical protein
MKRPAGEKMDEKIRKQPMESEIIPAPDSLETSDFLLYRHGL